MSAQTNIYGKMEAGLPAPIDAPATRGGILIPPPPPEIMASNEGLIFPVDDETGLPHLVRAFYDPFDQKTVDKTVRDYDHSWFYRFAPQLRGLGGRAVRLSMGQMLPIDIHRVKNQRFCRMSWMPDTEEDQFETTVNGVTGTVSRWVVDVRRPADNLLVRVDDAEFAFLTDRHRLFREKAHKDKPANILRDEIGAFFVHYAIQQNIRDIVSNRLIERYLNTEDPAQLKELGNSILKTALTAGVEPIASSHAKLKIKGLVRPDAPQPIAAVRKFIDKRRLPNYYPALTKKLLATA